MKKIPTLLLVLLLLLGILAGCVSDSPKQEETGIKADSADENIGTEETEAGDSERTESETDEPEKPKLNQDIIASSMISEGLAVVSCDKNSNTYYGISVDGTVAFELTLSSEFNIRTLERCEFVNGLMLIDGGFCDASGNMTYPEDVGVSNFYNQAIEEGYVLADIITSSFDGTVQKLGIMDTSFQWVVEPSEKLYQSLVNQRELVFTTLISRHYGSYCHEGYLYFDDLELFIELSTGRILSNEEGPQVQPSYSWDRAVSGGKYFDRNGSVMLDISHNENLSYCGSFTNGIGTVVFYNEEAKQHFVTAIDENGTFLFEPVSFNKQGEGYGTVWAVTDGNIIVAYEMYWSADGMVRTYDLNGNQLGEFNVKELTDNGLSVEVEEGVVIFRMGTLYGEMDTWMFTPEFIPVL